MRSLIVLAILILAIPIVGQVMLPHRHAVVGSGSVSPPTPPLTDLAWHWVASDLTAGSVVTNWLDRIQSTPWKGPGDATSPTNTATNGVYFNGAQVLTGSVQVVQSAVNTNVTMFFILQRTGSGAFQTLLSQDTGGSWLLEFVNATPKWHISASGLQKLLFGDAARTNPFDMAFSSYRTPSDNTVGYTNGVPCATNAGQYIMSVPQTLTRLGGIPGEPFQGYIREVFIYTNKLVDAQIATLHQYATNTYGYIP